MSTTPSGPTGTSGSTGSTGSTSWWWQRLDAAGDALEGEPEEFPTRGDAESWLGEVWSELAEEGVDAVVLHEGDREVYGPMSLKAQ